MINETIQILNSTFIQQTPQGLFIDSFTKIFIGVLPWILIFLALKKDDIAFWFDGYQTVNKLLKTIRKKTGMGVLLIAREIDLKTMDKIERFLELAERKGLTDVIFIIHTFGGSEFCTTRIQNAILNFHGRVHAYIPRYAMSAGTLISLSCHSIKMSPIASLGAVDIQAGILWWVFSSKQWQEVVKKKGAKADDNSIMMAMMAKQYDKLILSRMEKLPLIKDNKKLKTFLSNGNIPHAQQLDRNMLSKMGLPIQDIGHEEIMKIAYRNPREIKGVL